MGDPASEEEKRIGAGEISGGEVRRGDVKEVTGVIERHDDHDGAAQGVDGLETRTGFDGCGHFCGPLSLRGIVGWRIFFVQFDASERRSGFDGDTNA